MNEEDRIREENELEERLIAKNIAFKLQTWLHSGKNNGRVSLQSARTLAPVLYVLGVSDFPLTAARIAADALIELGNFSPESNINQAIREGIRYNYIENIDKDGIFVYELTKQGKQLFADSD
jgi:hypothetical protein